MPNHAFSLEISLYWK
jgi:hypothetical protein